MKLSIVALLSAIAHVSAEGGEDNAFEWAGTFAVADATHTWIMQKTGDPLEYVDPSMKLAVVSSTAISRRLKKRQLEGCEPQDPLFESLEASANALLEGACTPVNEGETFGPFTTDGGCFELINDPAKDTSRFVMNTEGITGKVVFAQHVPIEFERDTHYLQDSSGTDVEPVSQTGGGHHHHHGDEEEEAKPSCACVAADYGFNIDCSQTAAMTDALAFLRANNCACDCESDECKENWLLLQTHHDYCDPLGVPGDVNDSFHDFDEVCESCAIERQFIEGAPACPAPSCEDDSGNTAYANLVTNGCTEGCADKDVCRADYITLRTVHDSCDHDVLSQDSEEGLHDFEKSCFTVLCNTLTSDADDAAQLECTAAAGGSSSASKGAMTMMAAFLV